MTTPVIVLPWPNATLSPNAKPHWAVKMKAVKQARKDGFNCAKEAYGICSLPFLGYEGKLHLWVDFYPPTKRDYDDDNLLGRIKGNRDGIADFLLINDSRFISHPMIRDKVKGGCVKITITKGPHDV